MKEGIVVVATPLPVAGSGGSLRALRSVNEYSKYFDVDLFLPYGASRYQISLEFLRSLVRAGVSVVGFSRLPIVVRYVDSVLSERVPRTLTNFVFTFVARPRLFTWGRYRCVVSLHEDIDAVYAGYILSNLLNTPAVCLLQLPPFYGSRERLYNIMKAHMVWRRCLVESDLVQLLSSIETVVEYDLFSSIREEVYRYVLKRYDLVIAVSRSIPYEMGSEWVDKVYALDPGVSLDKKDLELVEHVKARAREKDSYIVFGGRPLATKGVIEALIVFRSISRRFSGVKLVFTGDIKSHTLRRIMYICRRLGIEDKVVFTGFIPRDKRFEVVAKAKAMLYPSHVDGFPYAVLEALYLGTPVIAYSIPALELYYSRNPGVRLAREWDLEALAIETTNILEKGVEYIEPPKIPSWREIIGREVMMIKRVIEKQRLVRSVV